MVWRNVLGYEGRYKVSDDGQVKSLVGVHGIRREKLRALTTDKGGYKRVTLKKDGVRRNHLVHHLVLIAFVGPKPEGRECRHLNGDPGDNRLMNLVWGTSSENTDDTVRHGHHPFAGKTHCKNGHEFTPENTIVLRNGGRNCRTCNKERAAAWYLANRKTGVPSNKDKTHCKRGHEFTPENTIRRSDGGRQCRACNRQYYQSS
jgi:hypothetical protein